jgi:DNA transposition AAA+ family ATPase
MNIITGTRNKLYEYLEKSGMSQVAIGNAIGKSATTINRYLHDDYKDGRVEDLERDIESFLALQEEKSRNVKHEVKFTQIGAAKQVFTVLSECHRYSKYGLIFGKAGYGKTTALKAYTNHHVGVVLVRSGVKFTAKDILSDICNRLGLDDTGHTTGLARSVLKKIKNSGRLIIVDEADYMTLDALDTIRYLYDESDNTIGVVLVGMPRLFDNVVGKHRQLEQLFGRLDRVGEISIMTQADAVELLKNNMPEAEAFAGQLLRYSEGRVRSFIKILNEARRLSYVLKKEVDEKIITEAWKGLKVLGN